jgi:hypothetical protein
MLLIYRTCYVGYQSMMHPVHYTTLSCNLYILSNAAIYEMLLTYKHVMHDTILSCMQSMHVIKCDRMLLSMMHISDVASGR